VPKPSPRAHSISGVRRNPRYGFPIIISSGLQMALAMTIQKMPEKLKKDEKSNLLSARKTENSYIQYRGNRGTLRQPWKSMMDS
jgi:hypothetical protein